jgi:hypothetical protein
MVQINPEKRISAEKLIKEEYFDSIRQNLDVEKPATKVVKADLNFQTSKEAVKYLKNEIWLLLSEF